MIWQFDYETLASEIRTSSEEQQGIIIRAYEYAKTHFEHDKEQDDFIVIRVEGYSCIALITNEFTPIEVHEHIFPYDAKRIYPMQGLCIRPQFIR